jgi:membrane-associated phospholipid phosphatase
VGTWRPTPPALAAGAGPQFAYMVPWAIGAPSQFRPGGPPALASARYAHDFNETKNMGSFSSIVRTPDQTVFSWFWTSSTASYIWNTLAASLINRTNDDDRRDSRDEERDHDNDSRPSRHNTTLEHARLFALLDLAMADAAIGCWEAKYTYIFWRPITAIPEAAADGNAATTPDPTWAPLFATPAHPEYPSGHSCVSGAAGVVLAAAFGEKTRFTVESDAMPGITRSFRSFSSALEEVANARVFAGIHFRSATDDGQVLGASVGHYVLEHAAQRIDR